MWLGAGSSLMDRLTAAASVCFSFYLDQGALQGCRLLAWTLHALHSSYQRPVVTHGLCDCMAPGI